jgi:hypothetical protein
MKKLFLALLAVLLVASVCYADATPTSTTNIKGGNADYAVGAIVDQTNGYTARVSSEGAVSTIEYPNEQGNTIATADGILFHAAGKTIKTGACRLRSIIYGGPTAAALDYVLVYDAATATGTPVLDLSIGVAGVTTVFNMPDGGLEMATGITVKSDGATVAHGDIVTVIYDD